MFAALTVVGNDGKIKSQSYGGVELFVIEMVCGFAGWEEEGAGTRSTRAEYSSTVRVGGGVGVHHFLDVLLDENFCHLFLAGVRVTRCACIGVYPVVGFRGEVSGLFESVIYGGYHYSKCFS